MNIWTAVLKKDEEKKKRKFLGQRNFCNFFSFCDSPLELPIDLFSGCRAPLNDTHNPLQWLFLARDDEQSK